MRKIYLLSNREKSTERPDLFSLKNEWIEEAKGIEANLRYTKKLKGDEFMDVWMNSPAVKRYRELLRMIWAFRAEKFVVEEVTCCDHEDCEVTENFFRVTIHTKNGDWEKFPLCDIHAKQYGEMWTSPGYSTFTVEKM